MIDLNNYPIDEIAKRAKEKPKEVMCCDTCRYLDSDEDHKWCILSWDTKDDPEHTSCDCFDDK